MILAREKLIDYFLESLPVEDSVDMDDLVRSSTSWGLTYYDWLNCAIFCTTGKVTDKYSILRCISYIDCNLDISQEKIILLECQKRQYDINSTIARKAALKKLKLFTRLGE